MSFIADAAKAVGNGLGDAAKAVGNVVVDAAKAVGNVAATTDAAKAVGIVATGVADVIVDGVTLAGSGLVDWGKEVPNLPADAAKMFSGGHNTFTDTPHGKVSVNLAGEPLTSVSFSVGGVDPFGPITHGGRGGLLGGIAGASAIVGLFAHMHPIQEAAHMIGQQQHAVSEVAGMLKGFIPVIGSGWKGDDAIQFGVDLNRKMLMALSGMDMSMGTFVGQINGAVDIVHHADHKTNRMVSELVDLFDSIF